LEILDERIIKFFFAIEAVGIIFVGFFLAAYLSGLPTTAVLHSEPMFKIPLFVFGVVLLLLVLIALILAASSRKK